MAELRRNTPMADVEGV